MTKRIFSILFAVLFAIGIVPLANVKTAAASETCYNVSKALEYAQKNWNNGVGLCADFASKCIQAGGVDVYCQTVIDLYNQLKGEYGKAYKLKLTNGTSGKISMADNAGKLKKGDLVFYRCNYCGEFEHVVVCNGANSEGYCRDYAHNNAHNGKKTTYTYSHCGGESWTMYSIHMNEGPKLYGKKTNVGVPAISSVANGANGIVIKWSKVENAAKYRVLRKAKGGSWKKLGDVTGLKFTDKTAKNGIEYTYVVKGVKGKTVSQYYAGEKITCIGAPSLTSVTNNATSVKLKWKKVSSADGYYVYRKGESGSWKQVAKIKGRNKISYTDRDVNSSETYKYTVRAYDGKRKGCYNYSGIKTIFLSIPDELSAKSGENGAVINFNKTDGAKTYDVYRKGISGDWEKISRVAGDSFVDLDVSHGETYCYSVKALSGKYTSAFNKTGVELEYSQPEVENTEAENEEVVA